MMLRALFFTSLFLSILNQATAQNKFYAQAKAGAGISNVQQKHYGSNPSTSSITAYAAGVSVGYKVSNWHIGIGALYMSTGCKKTGLVFEGPFGIDTTQYDHTQRYSHLLVPVTVGYEVALSNKLALLPLVGIAPSYNLGETTFLDGAGKKKKTKIDNGVFEEQYQRWSLFGMAEISIIYKINNHVSILTGPSYHQMLSNMYKKPDGPVPFNASQKNHALMVNAGIRIGL